MTLLHTVVSKSNCRYVLQNAFFCITRRYQSSLQNRIPEICKPCLLYDMNEIVPVFKKSEQHLDKIAVIDEYGKYTYEKVVINAYMLSKKISYALDNNHLEKVAFLCPNDISYVITQWAIWMSGQIALPLSHLHPQSLIEYFIGDSEAKMLVTVPKFAKTMEIIAGNTKRKLLVINDYNNLSTDVQCSQKGDQNVAIKNMFSSFLPPEFYSDADAMILYTSGTTSKPKGVMISHRNLQAQMLSMISAWKWARTDSILHSLPLHHVHGIVNALMCPLYVGARCVMLPKFDVDAIWKILLGINKRSEDRVNIFMAVPTIYDKLINKYNRIFKQDPKMVEYIHTTLSTKIRLMVSGSAPLPEPLFEKWFKISGHKLLERYGMTEIGMSLSNAYETGKNARLPGYVGLPLPGVSVKVARNLCPFDYETIVEVKGPDLNSSSSEPEILIFDEESDLSGELLVKGDTVFQQYYNKPHETKKEFTHDGWFRTGDSVLFDKQKCLFKILGRTSIDIIKTGGYKVSSLQVETILLEHPNIREVAVVSLPDETWGEKVAAIVVPKNNTNLLLDDLREWSKNKLAVYSIPTVLKIVDDIPRNAMGKVNKKDLIKTVFNKSENKL